MLVIRLQRRSKKNQSFFRVVLADKKSAVKGKYIEKLGFLNPYTKEVSLDSQRIKYWLSKGACPSDTVYNLLIEKRILEGDKKKIKI
ncbi:MAG: 30S ribosomal protein S16, partial [Candidatus Bathyarchaeota archaeon]|nr:30S ribosomal protein S16 [Candidatus Bathyarchaeota archaeon]